MSSQENSALRKLTKDCDEIKPITSCDIFDSTVLPTSDHFRWKKIEEALKSFIRNPNYQDFYKTVISYNESRKEFFWAFDHLTNHCTIPDLDKLLCEIAEEALRLPSLFKKIPILVKNKEGLVSFTDKEICCLLANAFFCTFTNVRDRKVKNRLPSHQNGGASKNFGSCVDQYYPRKMPTINFFNLLGNGKMGDTGAQTKAEKLKCILHYFRVVIQRNMSKVSGRRVTFHRKVLESEPKWESSTKKLRTVRVESRGFIEDQKYHLQVDFANRMVGGGVLGNGCVQEEIRFVICPDLIVSRLITEELGDKECLVVTGAERFSLYSGYSSNFKFEGEYKDETALDSHGRMICQVLMMDAINFNQEKEQFNRISFSRELNKAYCGFRSPGAIDEERSAVATGNWGCGAFNGNKDLKFLVQLLASTEACRDMCYFTFNDEEQKEILDSFCNKLKSLDFTVGDLYKEVVKTLKSTKFDAHHNKIRFFQKLSFFQQSSATSSEEDSENENTAQHHRGDQSPNSDQTPDEGPKIEKNEYFGEYEY